MTELMGKRLPWQNALPKRVDWSQRSRPPNHVGAAHSEPERKDGPVADSAGAKEADHTGAPSRIK